jgi:serine/threonine-protein kinase RsbW
MYSVAGGPARVPRTLHRRTYWPRGGTCSSRNPRVLPVDDEDKGDQLMTTYPAQSATTENQKAGADEPVQAVRVMLPAAAQAASLARRQVRDALGRCGLSHLEDTAVLLVSELVGNAVRHARHGGSELELRMADTGAWLRIEMSDADPRPPQPHIPAGLHEFGFGFVLVEALAAKWGVDQGAEGKTVWIELDTGRASHPDGWPFRNRPSAGCGCAEQSQERAPSHRAGKAAGARPDDGLHVTGAGRLPATETASVCRCAAALIRGLGWDPLAESRDATGPLPMDVAISAVTEARGYDCPDDILDAALTHIAGLLYAAGEVTRQTLVHDMTDVAMAWEARRGRTAEEVLAVLDGTASVLDCHEAATTRCLEDGPAMPPTGAASHRKVSMLGPGELLAVAGVTCK